jgi:hypothetical protein
MRTITILALAMWPDPALAGADGYSLRQAAESFAGAPVALDSRVEGNGCPGGYRLGWANAARQAIDARCAATGRRLLLPVSQGAGQGGAAPTPRLRRGEPILAETVGAGFRVQVEAITEGGAAAGGDVRLKNSRSGQRFSGRLVEDGRILVRSGSESR